MPSGAGTFAIASLSLVDAGRETGTFKVYGADLTAGNWTAQQGKFSDLVDAAMALVLGAKAATRYGNTVDFLWTLPANGAAREIALQILYVDSTTGQKFSTKLPTIDPSLITYVDNASARDAVITTTPAALVTFLAAFDAFAVNPYNGNTCEWYGVKVSRGGK